MSDKNYKNVFLEYYFKEINILYIIGTVATVIGFSIDLFNYEQTSPVIISINVFYFVLVVISFLLKQFQKITIDHSYFIISIITFLSFYSTYFFKILYNESVATIVFRDSVVYPFLLISVGFIAGIKRILYLGFGVISALFFIAFYSSEQIIIENSFYLGVMVFAGILGISLFLKAMEKSLLLNRKQKDLILQQNLDLDELNKKLAKSNADKNKLFSIIGHDLRGPIGNIKNMLSLIKANDLDKNEYEDLLKTIESASDSTYGLLLNLLTWARSEQGELVYEPQRFNIKVIIDEVVELVEVGAVLKSISLQNICYEKHFVFCDVEMVKTILRNLISNAIKFTNPGGSIIISSEKTDNQVFISVTDNGIGIAPEIVTKINSDEKIYSNAGTENEDGTGLGLELCRSFAVKNNGKILVESKLDEGSKFSFNLPCDNIVKEIPIVETKLSEVK